jgi:glyoxylase-like metal-dependent hydrolase (beta-lactamase superfamily II)
MSDKPDPKLIHRSPDPTYRAFAEKYLKKNFVAVSDPNSSPGKPKFETRYVYTGRGACAVLVGDEDAILVDAGCNFTYTPSKLADTVTGQKLLEKLAEVLEGRKILFVVISHLHEDHYNLLEGINGYDGIGMNQRAAIFWGGALERTIA